MPLTPRAPSTAAEGAVWLVVADGDEIADDLVADVGPSLEYLLGRRPILVADLAGAEDAAAAPTSFDVFDAVEQLGGLGTAVSRADCGYQVVSVGRDIAPAAALGMAEHDKEPARDIDDLQMILVCFLQDRQIAVSRREGDHAGQGWSLAELDRAEVLECVEVEDHASLALGDLFRQEAVPVARAWRSLHVFRLHAAALQVFEIAGIVDISDHVLGDAAVSEVPGQWPDCNGVDARPAVDDLTIGLGARISVLADLFLLEIADIAGGFEKGAGLMRDIRKDRRRAPVLLGLALLDPRHGAVELRKPRAFPARDIIVLGVVALDENALAGPAADQPRLRAIGRHVAAAGAGKCDDRVGRAGAVKPLLTFLETAVHAGGVEPLFGFDADRVVVLSHKGISFHQER